LARTCASCWPSSIRILTLPNLDFYAIGEDLHELLSFIYTHTDIVAFDSYSDFDKEVRRFESVQQIEAVHRLGAHPAIHLQLWSPAVMINPIIRRIELTGSDQAFRYAVEGAGLMQLYPDGVKDGLIYHTHFGCWSEAGARKRSIHPADDCDWRELSKVFGRLHRQIRREMAAAKLGGRPVLTHAFAAVLEGCRLSFGQEAFSAASREVQRLTGKP